VLRVVQDSTFHDGLLEATSVVESGTPHGVLSEATSARERFRTGRGRRSARALVGRPLVSR